MQFYSSICGNKKKIHVNKYLYYYLIFSKSALITPATQFYPNYLKNILSDIIQIRKQ